MTPSEQKRLNLLNTGLQSFFTLIRNKSKAHLMSWFDLNEKQWQNLLALFSIDYDALRKLSDKQIEFLCFGNSNSIVGVFNDFALARQAYYLKLKKPPSKKILHLKDCHVDTTIEKQVKVFFDFTLEDIAEWFNKHYEDHSSNTPASNRESFRLFLGRCGFTTLNEASEFFKFVKESTDAYAIKKILPIKLIPHDIYKEKTIKELIEYFNQDAFEETAYNIGILPRELKSRLADDLGLNEKILREFSKEILSLLEEHITIPINQLDAKQFKNKLLKIVAALINLQEKSRSISTTPTTQPTVMVTNNTMPPPVLPWGYYYPNVGAFNTMPQSLGMPLNYASTPVYYSNIPLAINIRPVVIPTNNRTNHGSPAIYSKTKTQTLFGSRPPASKYRKRRANELDEIEYDFTDYSKKTYPEKKPANTKINKAATASEGEILQRSGVFANAEVNSSNSVHSRPGFGNDSRPSDSFPPSPVLTLP